MSGKGVHISYLIVTMVISLGLIVAVVLTNSELQTAREQKTSADGKVKDLEDKVRGQTSEITAMRKLLTGNEDDRVPEETSETLAKAGELLAASLGTKNAEEYDSFPSLITDTMENIKRLKGEVERQTAAAEAHLQSYQSMIEEKAALETAKNGELEGVRAELNQALAQLEADRASNSTELAKLREDISNMSDTHADEVSDLKTEVFLGKNKNLQLSDRVQVLEREINKEKTFAEVTPDGEILRVADEDGFAWINIGREKRLRRGLVFDVFQYVKGGRKLRKGKVEVARVEDDYAEVRIIQDLDKFNPISAGDKIASPFYDETAVPVFVIAGDALLNKRFSKDEVVRRIERFGGQVEGAVRVETTYLVAIDGYQDTTQYKTARELGVTILRENELLEFIGF